MRLSRLYTPQPLTAGSSAELDEARSHYLSRVLRLGVGARIHVFNGDGREFPAELTAVGKKHVHIAVGEPFTPATESPLHTVLGLGISRGERMDYAIQKSTELGVSVIVPLFTEHCEVRLDGERQDKRLEHWRGVAISACEQCGRVVPPVIEAPQTLLHWVASEPAGLKLLFDHTQTSGLPAERPQQGVALLIGPEGGLAPAEIQKAQAAGFTGIALGKRIFRTETAPVAALSVLQYLWG
ncbi:MAG: 16S rRNA (uracil(1498)-N(3))-methyltransferase [Pseudohongiellaceae bacterium]|jgi:16S rRNA (uracil1498-N3)-methyltransferase